MRCQSCHRQRDELAFDVLVSRRGPRFDCLDEVCMDCRAAEPQRDAIDEARERTRLRKQAWYQRRRAERRTASA